MSVENEVKVLSINIDETKRKLKEIGAKFIGKKEQSLYTYDVPTIYYRFLEIKELLHSSVLLTYETNLKKFYNLLCEVNDLILFEEKKYIRDTYGLIDIVEIVKKDKQQIISFVDDIHINGIFEKLKINTNKWIRLRKSNDKVELTVKHILSEPSNENMFQNVIESEIAVSSFEDTNEILEKIGIVKRNYQEKIRYSYEYNDAKIEIDLWPMLMPYLEIECNNIDTINDIIFKLGLNNNEVISCNTELLYRRIGIDVLNISELRF